MAAPKKKTNVLVEYRAMNQKQLNDKLAELRKESVEQRRALAAGEIPSAAAISKTRKNIAKVLTVLQQQATAPQEAPKEQEK